MGQIINGFVRKWRMKLHISQLKNKDFSIIASNCNGGCVCHDFQLRFNSPFVNLLIFPKDYIKLLKKMDYYLAQKLLFIKDEKYACPVALLDDVKIIFMHYDTEKDAANKWYARVKRINKKKLFIMFTDRDGCTIDDLREFDGLPYDNKIVFTKKPYPEIKSSYYIKGYECEECVGILNHFIDKFSGRMYYDQFPFVQWFNGELS